MMKKLIFIVLFVLLVIPSVFADYVNYEVVEVEATGKIKASIIIIIDQKLTKDELRHLATSLYRKNDLSRFQKIYMDWYLTGMKIEAGAWATTHFEPNLKVVIRDWMLDYNPTTLKKNG